MTTTDIVIAGAGCAGLSLGVHLLDAGVRDRRIVLVEPRRRYAADRTWSFWRMDRHPFESCVGREWRSWRVRAGGRSVVRASERHPYQQIESPRFYAHALSRLRRAPNVELRLGERVLAVRDRGAGSEPAAGPGRGVEVVTDRASLDAALVFDSRPPRRRGSPDGELCQHFLGWEVVMPRPVFDTSAATLMDFGPSDDGGVGFTYVLPSAPDRALVEATWISPAPFAPGVYRRALRAYLARRFDLQPLAVEREESGVLPMSRRPLPRSSSRRVIRIGIAGGAVRPSTGYGFLAIQRSCAALARRVARGVVPAPPAAYRRRSRLLDRIFLTTLRRDAARGPALFLELFERAPADSLVRFLSDRGSWLDDLRVVAAMPKAEMSATALRMLRPTWASA